MGDGESREGRTYRHFLLGGTRDCVWKGWRNDSWGQNWVVTVGILRGNLYARLGYPLRIL